METPRLSFRDVVVGKKVPRPRLPPPPFPQPSIPEEVEVAESNPNLECRGESSMGEMVQSLLTNYKADRGLHMFQRMSRENMFDADFFLNPSNEVLPASDFECSSKEWSPSRRRGDEDATNIATLVMDDFRSRYPPYYSGVAADNMGWNPFQSRDFLSEMLQEVKNEQLVNLKPLELKVVAAAAPPGPSISSLQTISAGNIRRDSFPRKAPPPFLLDVTSKKLVNFSQQTIQFQVKVSNIPRELSLKCSMFEAQAFNPSGKPTLCSPIRKDSAARTYCGYFKSSKETGNYELQVRMSVPEKYRWINLKGLKKGFICKTEKVLVSKNYLQDSQFCYSVQFCYITNQNVVSLIQKDSSHPKLWGLTCDTLKNNIYFTDRPYNAIMCMDASNGKVLSNFGGSSQPGNPPCTNRPTGLAFDSIHRRLVVADKDYHRISLFTEHGQYISSFGSPGHNNGEFNYPWDVAVSPTNGNIAVTDSMNHRIQLFDRFGNYLENYSVYEKSPLNYKSELDFPRGCSFDAEGNFLYVTDYKAKNVLELPADISSCRKIISEDERRLRRPQGVVSDDQGNLLVADSKNNCIRLMTRDGGLISTIHTTGKRPLDFPVNLTLVAGGKLAVLDGNGMIHFF